MNASSAFLALWNDFAPGREAEYEAWHSREHVPERVAAPGFRSGRRYLCPAHPAHRWFTLYDVASPDCFETPQYRDLLHNPTPWSSSMRPDFRNFLRVPCATVGTAGLGIGGALAVLRLPDNAATPQLDDLARQDGLVRAWLGRRIDRGQREAAFRAGEGGSGADDAFETVLLMEALSRGAAERAFAAAAQAHLPAGTVAAGVGGVYDLAFVFPGSDPAERRAHRRAHWPEE